MIFQIRVKIVNKHFLLLPSFRLTEKNVQCCIKEKKICSNCFTHEIIPWSKSIVNAPILPVSQFFHSQRGV